MPDFGSLSPGMAEPRADDAWAYLQALRSGFGSALQGVGSHLGIPHEVRNARGEVVFPTNEFERWLAGTRDPTMAAALSLGLPYGRGLGGPHGGDFIPLPPNAVRMPAGRIAPSRGDVGFGEVSQFAAPKSPAEKYAEAFKAQTGRDYLPPEAEADEAAPAATWAPSDYLAGDWRGSLINNLRNAGADVGNVAPFPGDVRGSSMRMILRRRQGRGISAACHKACRACSPGPVWSMALPKASTMPLTLGTIGCASGLVGGYRWCTHGVVEWLHQWVHLPRLPQGLVDTIGVIGFSAARGLWLGDRWNRSLYAKIKAGQRETKKYFSTPHYADLMSRHPLQRFCFALFYLAVNALGVPGPLREHPRLFRIIITIVYGVAVGIVIGALFVIDFVYQSFGVESVMFFIIALAAASFYGWLRMRTAEYEPFALKK